MDQLEGTEKNFTLYDASGEEVLCKCGKPPAVYIRSPKTFNAWCAKCSESYSTGEEAELVLRLSEVDIQEFNKWIQTCKT